MQKHRTLVAVALIALAGAPRGMAQTLDQPIAPPPGQALDQTAIPAPPPPPETDPRLDALFEALENPDNTEWEKTEAEIMRIWSRSGSPAMDLLLERGQKAMEEGDNAAAVEHFSALVDHAPEFAEGWNARATAFYLLGEYSLSIADIERVLALNPRHFGAMAGLAFILEDMGEPKLALRALKAAQALNPHREAVNQGVARLERELGAADL